MESRFKILGIAVAFCAALAAGPGFAQEDAPATDRDVPRGDGGTGNGAAIKGLPTNGAPDGNRTTPPPNLSPRVGESIVTNGIDPVGPEGGSASLQRRANRKALIANAPKTAAGSPASNARIGPPLAPPGASGAATHNAIGAVMPGGQTSGYSAPSFTVRAGSGVTAVVAPGRDVGGVSLHRAPVPLNAGPTSAGLNGTMMGHIASGTGSIGGPAKDRSGINGTAIRSKH
jgi:hypothetical protein